MSTQANEHSFLNRLNEIPMINAFSQSLVSVYANAKNLNPIIGGTLEKAEGYAKLANEKTEPLRKLVQGPLSTANRIADQQLENLQAKFPIINARPEELKKYGQNLIGKTGLNKINPTDTLIKSILTIQMTLSQLVGKSFDITENLIDQYIAKPDTVKSCTDKGTYFDRVQCISRKLIDGTIYRTVTAYESVKNYATHSFEFANHLITNASGTTRKMLIEAGQTRQRIVKEISTRSHAISAKSESTAVYLTKAISNGIANITDRVINSTAPYLPEGMEKPALALVSYAHHWQGRVQNASTAGEIWKAAMDETKRNLRLARELVQSILNNHDAHVKDTKHW